LSICQGKNQGINYIPAIIITLK